MIGRDIEILIDLLFYIVSIHWNMNDVSNFRRFGKEEMSDLSNCTLLVHFQLEN